MQKNSRVLRLNEAVNEDGKVVIYVMSRDQRVHDNHALVAAQAEALEASLPLLVVFNLYSHLGQRRREHFRFMVDGLREVQKELGRFDIPFIVVIGNLPDTLTELNDTLPFRSLYFDFSPLRHSRKVQKAAAKRLDCRVSVVDTHNIVPVWVTSDKEEFAAHTIRRKLHKGLEAWCVEPDSVVKHPYRLATMPKSATWNQVDAVVEAVEANGIQHGFDAGETAAKKALQHFLETGLKPYAPHRNDASMDAQSNLSPYLHYGQLASLRIVLELLKVAEHPPKLFISHAMPSAEDEPTLQDSIDAFMEELVVRKELTDNFCFYNSKYDRLSGAKEWAQKTLRSHADDPREFLYDFGQFERAETHDPLWNAAQIQLRKIGKIHGYMRMYWAKKILEWSASPDEAIKIAIALNDRYHLDGGDPNGYVGVMWSIAGVHDRPWFDRSIYGQIRYMTANGIKKKFDSDHYIELWAAEPQT